MFCFFFLLRKNVRAFFKIRIFSGQRCIFESMQHLDSLLVYIIENINANPPNFGRRKLVSVVYCLVYSISFSFGESSPWEDYFISFLSFIMEK